MCVDVDDNYSFREQIAPRTVSPMPLAEGCTVWFTCVLCLCQPTSKPRKCDWRLCSTTIHSCLSSGSNTTWQKFQQQCTCSNIDYMWSISPILSRVNSATVHTCVNVPLLPFYRHQHHDMLITTTMTSSSVFSTVPTQYAWAQQAGTLS